MDGNLQKAALKGKCYICTNIFVKNLILILFSMALAVLTSCRQIDITEKVADIPQHAWRKKYQAIIELEIKDSAVYNLYFIVRHSEKYRFSSILTNLTIRDTANRFITSLNLNAPLVKKDGSWSGISMDDLYETRLPVNYPLWLRPGWYRFIFRQQMLEDPLNHVLNVGLGFNKKESIK